jgi:ribonuclease HII
MPSSRYERAARSAGYRAIAGLDEAGRGALFGPVFAAAVVLDPARQIRGLDDSKQLEPERREVLAGRIRERAVAWSIGAADAYEIDRVNILEASRLAMERALNRLSVVCDYLLLDAIRIGSSIPQAPHRRRRVKLFHRRGLDPRQDRARPGPGALGCRFSAIRLRAQ